MTTRIGFFGFLGLVLGAIIGNWLPFAPTIEAVAGCVIAIVLGFLLDRRAPENRKKGDS
ncbi:hypothetical protein [Gimibacter soli]|uniref:Uncharacterized protein n=1 Tax=Gimibacter soli TaxID=3024400 RepID=A0AAE9XU60_9PROT|nr:hypothetical protein [Gimibacter soli]WCL52749.1 hypothetical protein PH603_09380 [Gimibacter soli]